MRQRAVIDKALDDAGDDGTVHVYGDPDLPLRKGLESMCDDGAELARVLFHSLAVPVTTGGYACPTCGKTSGVIDGTA